MPRPSDVPQAVGSDSPCWPLEGATRRVTSDFGKTRAGGTRYHVGEDLPAPEGAIVRAMEPGEVVGYQTFNGPRAFALLVHHDSGLTVLYGEVLPDSWREWGLGIGSRVERCQPIARVGVNPRGSTMLHLETYAGKVTRNQQWWVHEPPAPVLRNPTEYLRRAIGSPDPRPPAPEPKPSPVPEPVPDLPLPFPAPKPEPLPPAARPAPIPEPETPLPPFARPTIPPGARGLSPARGGLWPLLLLVLVAGFAADRRRPRGVRAA